MSTTAAAVTVLVFLVVALTGAHWLACRLRRAAATRDRLIREACNSYQGPDSLRLMQDLDAHLDTYATQLDGLYEPPHIAPDPVLAAGVERLWDAIRDQQNGDTP